MGKLHEKLSKLSIGKRVERSLIDKETFDELHPLSAQVDNSYDAAQASKKALKDAADQPVIPLPDEEELDRARRRRTARRGGGRASTVLSDDTRLGG